MKDVSGNKIDCMKDYVAQHKILKKYLVPWDFQELTDKINLACVFSGSLIIKFDYHTHRKYDFVPV